MEKAVVYFLFILQDALHDCVIGQHEHTYPEGKRHADTKKRRTLFIGSKINGEIFIWMLYTFFRIIFLLNSLTASIFLFFRDIHISILIALIKYQISVTLFTFESFLLYYSGHTDLSRQLKPIKIRNKMHDKRKIWCKDRDFLFKKKKIICVTAE